MNDLLVICSDSLVFATPTFSFSFERLKRGQGLFDSHPNPCIDLCNKSFKAVLGWAKEILRFLTNSSYFVSLSFSFPNLTSVKDGGGKSKTVKLL